jgi:hypothetical protein
MCVIHTWSKFTTSAFKAAQIEERGLHEAIRWETYDGQTGEGRVIMAREMNSTGDAEWKLVVSVTDFDRMTIKDKFIPLKDLAQVEWECV